MTLTENDYPMATVDDLNVLLDTLAHEADRKSVYILQLPAVTYEGGLTMKNFCCDLVGSEGGTTFTGTVTIATRGIHPSNITNVRFVGDGTGIGLSASEAARRARAATMATACTKTTAPPCASPRCRAQRRWISITACSAATG